MSGGWGRPANPSVYTIEDMEESDLEIEKLDKEQSQDESEQQKAAAPEPEEKPKETSVADGLGWNEE